MSDESGQASAAGMPPSFEELVREYSKRVLSIAYDYVKDYDLAQDVAQDVFIRVWQKGSEFKAQASLFSWIYRITVNLSIDHLRKSKSRDKLSESEGTYTDQYRIEQESGTTAMVPDAGIETSQLRQRIDASVEVLSENQKQAFILRYYQDMSIEEIASIMGCQESTVRQHLFRASHKLRDQLSDLADRIPGSENERDEENG